MKSRLLFSLLICVMSACSASAATFIAWKEAYLPMNEAGSKGLETLLVWPDDGEKQPLALINHGSPRDATKRPDQPAKTIATEKSAV